MKETFVFLLLILFFDLASINVFGQRSCGTPVFEKNILSTSKRFRKNRDKIENFQKENSAESKKLLASGVITIPVIVHVIFNNPDEKISLYRIQEQIDILNEDFRARNSDISSVPDRFKGLIGDSQIEFRLAIRTPNNQATNGVNYIKTNIPEFFLASDNVKNSSQGGQDPWDPEHYLNIWVCNLNKYLGYATRPGLDGPIKSKDGVVIKYTAFGSVGTTDSRFNLGRTTTHEVGHWLDLGHIWGDCTGDSDECCSSCIDEDGVDDTPPQNKCNTGTIPFNANPISCQGTVEMFVNYMDYVDDNTMIMFSQGQCARMLITLNFTRRGILTSRALTPLFASEKLNKLF